LLPSFVKNPRLFLYAGFGLMLLASASLPAKVRVVVQPEVMETELYWLGPIFAIMIGVWSLPTLLLGILESSMSKRAVLWWFSSILLVANIVLALSIWDAIRFWRLIPFQWLQSYSVLLFPCLLADVIGFLYFGKKEKFTEALRNPRIRIPSLCVLTGVPLLIAATLLFMWLATVA